MSGSRKGSEDSQLFQEVFTEGPLEELTIKCDVITAASLVGSSKLHIDSSKHSATLHASQPFGLPCVLHSHPTTKPWECNEYFEGKGTTCKLIPLDRFTCDAVMPNCMGKQWVGAKGDWIATVGHECNWQLVNVYTRLVIGLPRINEFVPTEDPFTFMHGDDRIVLQKIAICKVPTAADGYSDYSVIAIFDFAIACIESRDYGWTVLQNQFQLFFRYTDAVILQGIVFAVTERGAVYAWDPMDFGPILLPAPPDAHIWPGDLDDMEHEYEPGLWFLAIYVDGSRLLLVHTKGVTDDAYHGGTYHGNGHPVADTSVDRCGRTVSTYATGFGCRVYSKDTRYLYPPKDWEVIADLGAYSLFLGLNYPIFIAIGGAGVAPGYLTRSNCVYTSHHAAGLGYKPCPEICRFSLNGEDAAVGFSTNVNWTSPETPLWFVPSFANALEWNRT